MCSTMLGRIFVREVVPYVLFTGVIYAVTKHVLECILKVVTNTHSLYDLLFVVSLAVAIPLIYLQVNGYVEVWETDAPKQLENVVVYLNTDDFGSDSDASSMTDRTEEKSEEKTQSEEKSDKDSLNERLAEQLAELKKRVCETCVLSPTCLQTPVPAEEKVPSNSPVTTDPSF